MRVSLHHRTRYAFSRPLSLSPHIVRLRPAPHTRTLVEAYSLRIVPFEHFLVAESRRAGRFFAFGHTPGAFPEQEEPSSPLFPLTLDLRR